MPRLRRRRGSALVLVLVMTLAVAALAVAAIFLSGSAGLLSRFYDRERDFRLAAESALEVIRSRMEWDDAFPTIGTGVAQVAAGMRIRGADGALEPRVSVNVWAVQAGDTGATALPTVTLLAVAYDVAGTRYARRMDLRRESFSNYQLFVDTFPSGTFGPGQVAGRVHTNDVWRSSASAATAPTYRGRVTAVNGFAGLGTFLADSVRGVAPIPYPSDSTFPELAALAAAGGLSITPVNNGVGGFVNGSRIEFVARDVNANGRVEATEGFLRVFDLEPFRDTVLLRVAMPAYDIHGWPFAFGYSTRWSDPVIQNQCGAFYFRNSAWHFIPVATHRQSWFNSASNGLLVGTGSSNYPQISNGQRNDYTGYNYDDTRRILQLPTARCFPVGSPFLVTTERFTNASCQITLSAADTIPFGVASGCFPSGKYGGSDTTFTKRVGRCSYLSDGSCDESNNVGAWRDYPSGNALSDVATSIVPLAEQQVLWPILPPRNANAKGVVHITGGPIFLSGTLAGKATVLVSSRVEIVDDLRTAREPAADSSDCEHQMGIIAVGDVVVTDNVITRGRRISSSFLSSTTFSQRLGGSAGLTVQASLMSLTGSVGVSNPAGAGLDPQPCPGISTSNSSGGCWYLQGSAAMRRFGGFSSATNAGLHYAGTPSHCPATSRPPHFPLVNRYTVLQSVDVAPALANTPAKVQALLLRLKGKSL